MSSTSEPEARGASSKSETGSAVSDMRKLGLASTEAGRHTGAAKVGGSSSAEVATSASAADDVQQRDDFDLQRYAQLQQRIAELQGLQIEARIAHTQRSEQSLRRRLAVLRQLQQEAQQALEREGAQHDKLGAGKWFPGKLLLQNADKKLAASFQAVEQAADEVMQRDQQVASLQRQLHAMQRRLEVWEAKAGKLSVAQAEVAVMEERMFHGPSPTASQRRLELFDCLCALEESDQQDEQEKEMQEDRQDQQGEEEEEEKEEQDAASGEGEAAVRAGEQGEFKAPRQTGDGFGRWGRGRLLRMVTAKLGRPAEGGKDQYGRFFRGRLLRIAADKLDRAAAGEELIVEVEGSEDVEVEVEGQPFKLEEVKDEAEQEAPQPPKPQGFGQGRILNAIASRLGRVDSNKHKDQYGGYGRGRLLRIAADKLQRAAGARRKEREAAVRQVAGAIGASTDQEVLLDDEALKELFPPWAASFNPALHCPPSTFLWTYPNRFMGRLKRLRTGDVVHAYYRFGPFGSDPESSGRLASATPGIPGSGGSGGGGNGGLPLLMLSGLGSTMISWGVPLMRALSVSHEVIIMDYRGSGLSKYDGTDAWDYFKQAEAVLMLADVLHIPRFNWVGWSSGGDVGLVLAALHGNRLGKMVSHAGVAGGKNSIAPPTLHYLDPDAQASLGQMMALIFPPNDPQDFRRTCAQYIKEVYSMPKSILDAEPTKVSRKEQFLADQHFLANEEQVWAALPRVKVPCLISNGTADVLVPKENAERLAERIPDAQLHLFEGWGHGWKDSAAFAKVIDDFLCNDSGE